MSTPPPLFTFSHQAWACPLGGFSLDAHAKDSPCVVTHAHKDHYEAKGAHPLHVTPHTAALIRARQPRHSKAQLPPLEEHDYHAPFALGGVQVTFLPSGHMLGAAQVLVQDVQGRRGLFTGDVMAAHNPTCLPLATPGLPVDEMVVECTFGGKATHPDPAGELMRTLGDLKMPAMVGVYAAGKAQRINALLSGLLPGLPVLVEHEIALVHRVYEACGAQVGQYALYQRQKARKLGGPHVRLVPVQELHRHAHDEGYLKFLASGWAQAAAHWWIADSLDISDHASGDELMAHIKAVNPRRVTFWHGSPGPLVAACADLGMEVQVAG